MEEKELLKKLKVLIDAGTKKIDIEKEIGIPQNNLSGIIKGTKVLPKKWVQPLEDYINFGLFKKTTIRIYKLINPIDEKVFYIGRTFSPLTNRLKAHIKEMSDGMKSKKREIIKSLIDCGFTPIIEEIELFECTTAEDELRMSERELYWIEYYNEISELTNVEGIIRPYKNKASLRFKNRLDVKDCYDGKKFDKVDFDEVGQWQEPKNVPRETNEEIKKQIEVIRAEKRPDHIKTPLGIKSWQHDQNKRIEELNKKINQ
jgi:hypothetical protein